MWLAGVIVHVIGLLVGASITGALGFLVGDSLFHPPMWILSLLAGVLALAATRLVGIKLEGSRWRVPGKWSQMGHVGDSAAFGVMVGTGVATALASPGFYLLVAWSVTAPQFSAVWPVFAAFGVGRAVPFLIAGARAYRHHNDVGFELDDLVQFTNRLGIVEGLFLAALAPIFLLAM